MTKTLTSLQEAAALLLDTLEAQREVTLDVTAQDATADGLRRLIMSVHTEAQARRLQVTMTATGERSIRLTLADP